MSVDLQLQLYILAGVFGLISIILVFFMAGICGQLSSIKKQQRKLHFDHGPIAAYDNYAYNSRNIQPDEELGRRGFSMYDPYRNNQTANVHQTANNGRNANMQNIIQQSTSTIETVTVAEGNRDDTTEYSIANAETVVMTGNDIEMKIKGSYPPEFRGIPPPPAFVNRFDIACEPNTSNAKTDEYQQK